MNEISWGLEILTSRGGDPVLCGSRAPSASHTAMSSDQSTTSRIENVKNQTKR